MSLFVGDWAGGRVTRLSASTGAVEGDCPVGKDPAGLVLDRKGRLYVADRESRQVSVIDTARMTEDRRQSRAAPQLGFGVFWSLRPITS